MTSADTNLFLYAANPASPHHEAATDFFRSVATDPGFVICELVPTHCFLKSWQRLPL